MTIVIQPKKQVVKPRTREEIIRAGNIARREAIYRRDVATQQSIQKRREAEARRKEEERLKAELEAEKKRIQMEAIRLQNEEEAKRKADQMEFWRRNKERMSFVDVGSGPMPLYGTQTIGGKFEERTDPKTGKTFKVLTSEAEKKYETLLQKQMESIETRYGQKQVTPSTETITSKPGQTTEQTLIEKGLSKQEAKQFISQLEKDKSGSAYKIQRTVSPSGESRFEMTNVTELKRLKREAEVKQRYESLSIPGKVSAHITTLGSPKASWEYVTASIPTEKIPYLKEGIGAKTPKEVVIKEFTRITGPEYRMPKTFTGRVAVGAGGAFDSAPVHVEKLILVSAGVGLYGATATGAKILGSTAGKVGFTALGTYYYGSRGKEAYSLAKEKRFEEALGVGVRTIAETGAIMTGGRIAIKESVMLKAKELPPAKRAEFFKKFKAVEKLKAPEIKEVDLSKVERIPSKKAGRIIEAQIKQRDLILGGSSAERAQLKKPSILKPSDVDIYTPWYRKPMTEAKMLEASLKGAGVKRVSRVRAEVTIGGKKAVEFHKASEYLYSNIKTVEGVLTPTRTQVGKTPSGIKVLKIKPQLKRELVAGMLEGSAKHYERFGKTFPDVASQQPKTFKLPKIGKGMVKSVIPTITPGVSKAPIKITKVKYPTYKEYTPYKPVVGYRPYDKGYRPYVPIPIPVRPYPKKTIPVRPYPPYRPRPIITPPYKPRPIVTPPAPPYKKGKKPIITPPYKPVVKPKAQYAPKITPAPRVTYKGAMRVKVKRQRKITPSKRRSYTETRKYKPSLVGVLTGKQIKKAPTKRLTGIETRGYLKKRRRGLLW